MDATAAAVAGATLGGNVKTLYLDIECSPHLVWTWDMKPQFISADRVKQFGAPMSAAWKWKAERPVTFASDHDPGHAEWLALVHAALDEADLVVHFYGTRFDVKRLNGEFAKLGMKRPSPFQQLDLYTQAGKFFDFPYKSLDHLLIQLGLDGKVKHSGFKLWLRCMAGEASAWEEMGIYNKRDVVALEELHERLAGWLPNSPNARLYLPEGGDEVCPECGAAELRREGHRYTQQGKYQRYACKACGAWSTATRSVTLSQIRSES